MRKIFIVTMTLMVLSLTKSFSQFSVTIGSATEVVPGTNVTIDVTANGFTNLLSAQWSMSFDSLVLKYSSATNFQTNILGITSQMVSGPNGGVVKNGQITFSWSAADGKGKTVANGTRLFSLVFNTIGAKCTSSDVNTSNKPTPIEIADESLHVIPFTSVKGNIKLKCDGGDTQACPDPICTNANNLQIKGGKVPTTNGATISVPFTVDNFNAIQSGQGVFKWDPAKLQYIEHIEPATGGLTTNGFGFGDTNVGIGELFMLWTNQTPSTPLTLPNNSKIIDLRFKVLTNAPDTACVEFIGKPIGSQVLEWVKEGVGEIPVCVKNGKVFFGSNPVEPMIIKVGNASGKQDEIICVDVTITKFTNITSFATKFLFNGAELDFVRTDMYSLDGLTLSNFNNGSGFVNISWSNANGVTKPDGSKIFQLCFKLKGPCPGMTNISFSIPDTEVSSLINGVPTTVPTQTMGGVITCTIVDPVNPPVITCTSGTVTNVDCNGRSTGAGSVNITGTKLDECEIVWSQGATVVKPLALITPGINTISNLAAGTYKYVVTWSKEDKRELCSGTITITEPTVINIPTAGVVTNAACGNKGSINISLISGGTPPYNYAWMLNLGNTANPTNLDAGQYSVTVTDNNGCTATQSFTVGNTITDLILTVSATNVKCKGDATGSLNIVTSGGCAPYINTISGGAVTNLTAGSYSVTVTDANGMSKTATATISEPTNALAIGTPVVVDATAGINNGSITLNVSGGTSLYNVAWTSPLVGGSTSGAFTTNNVAPGTYNATVTDANGCTATVSNVVVKQPVIDDKKPSITSATASAGFNGFGVSCFGDSNGYITAVIDGKLPITAQLISNGANVGTAQTISSGTSVSFSNLKAGVYTFKLTNTVGDVTSQSLEIKQPTKLTVTNTTTCTEEDKTTGSIQLNVGTSGVSPYSYNWASSETTSSLTSLGRGLYNVTVTDANGCTAALNNIEVKNCDNGNGTDCYIANKVITPSLGDNLNDKFVISCVENVTADLTIFDRWGKQVYYQIDYDNSWSGVDDAGKDLNEGGYIWVLTNRLGQGKREIYKGVVTILR
jgi:hypothetical protein